MKITHIILGVATLSTMLITSANAHSGSAAVDHQCREFTRTIVIGGEPQQGVGTACLQSDGSWQIVSDAKVPATIKGEAPVKVIEKETIVYRDRHHGHGSYGKRYGYSPYYYGSKRYKSRFGKRFSSRFGKRHGSRFGFGYRY